MTAQNTPSLSMTTPRGGTAAPLTATDVAFSINRWIEPGEPRPRTGLLRPYIDRAEVVNETTIDVHLKYASAAILQLMGVDFMLIFPRGAEGAGVRTV